MADINEIDLDVEAIRSSASGVVLNINDNAGNYSDEWLTTGCISNSFQAVNDALTSFESAKGVLLGHLDELDAISAEVSSKASQLSSLISRFPSRRNNTTASVSTEISSLNVRSGPGTDNAVVGYASKGSVVTVVGKDNNTGWTEVLLDNGTRGYVATKYLTNTSDSPEVSSQVSSATPTPSATPAPTPAPAPAPSASATPVPPSTADSGKQVVESVPTNTDNTAYVNTQTAGLNVRTGKGTDTSIITSATKGSTLTVLEKDDGSGWTKVRLGDGTTGYVSTSYLRTNNNQTTPVSPKESTTATPDVTASQGSNLTAYVNTQSAGLNVRTGKGTDTAIITSATKGSTLTVLEKDDGSGWTKVRLGDGTTGYVSSPYINMRSSNSTLYNGTAVVNTNTSGLNLRSSENGNIITSIPKGTKIEIGESANGWTKAKYNGIEGYISTEWLSDIKNGED